MKLILFLFGWLKLPHCNRYLAGELECPVCNNYLTHAFLGNPRKPNKGKWECLSCGHKHKVYIQNPKAFCVNTRLIDNKQFYIEPICGE